MAPASAVPDVYYYIFGLYEPVLAFLGFIGVLADPKAMHDSQATDPATATPLARATLVTIIQLGHTCALLGLLNLCILRALRAHLAAVPAIQERLATALLTPLLVGDVLHIVLTLWALGDARWDLADWSATTWATVVLGLTLLVPRAGWHAGVGRYVDTRDGAFQRMADVPSQLIARPLKTEVLSARKDTDVDHLSI
ncbi:hypothetical protein BD626DRAFT_564663 [Schizophyllum amplum]|uniref:DUF7704 domain-containing protein n=1 Tax=Schizophyllum amplum TaxID=97359 RepID=A0A550CSJ9_9AGAR|nr:hypothetical protein BD626DRAFT_564663 [Auriculariopsis ampla]